MYSNGAGLLAKPMKAVVASGGKNQDFPIISNTALPHDDLQRLIRMEIHWLIIIFRPYTLVCHTIYNICYFYDITKLLFNLN